MVVGFFSGLEQKILSITSEDLKLVTDASSTIGFGAVYKNSWIQGRWDVRASLLSIDVKELFAIVAAVLIWGTAWEGKRIVFIMDNLPITHVWQRGSSASKPIKFLTRKLHLVAAKFGFSISLKHIIGTTNTIADSLSRFQDQRFRLLMPTADLHPIPMPSSVDLLLKECQINQSTN